MSKVVAICVSEKKGTKKKEIKKAKLVKDKGIEGDAHFGFQHRQVSLLDSKSVGLMNEKGVETHHGIFAENIVTEGIDLHKLPVGKRLHIGDTLLEVTQIGKDCHHGCEIYNQVGMCIMPTHGIFCRVLKEGIIEKGMMIKVIDEDEEK